MKMIQYFWVDHPGVDWLLSFAIALAVWMFAQPVRAFSGMTPSVLVTVFQGLAGISATLAGFTLAGISFMIGNLRTTLDKLDAHWKRGASVEIKSFVFLPLRYLALTFVASITVVGLNSAPGVIRIVVVAIAIGAAAASASALGRNTWLIARLARV